ncbi:MAG: hypothetical protein H7Z21_18240, partial [Hymenobacter sp.]|nr:hypothetical protein [Hymenobacter sp.]
MDTPNSAQTAPNPAQAAPNPAKPNPAPSTPFTPNAPGMMPGGGPNVSRAFGEP